MSELDGQARHKDFQEYFLRSDSNYYGPLFAPVHRFDSGFRWPLAPADLWVGERFLSSYPLLLILTAGYLAVLAQTSVRGCYCSSGPPSPDGTVERGRRDRKFCC